jgi:hypothetical protein
MKKEVGVAIFFGILLGLGVAFFMVSRIRNIETPQVSPGAMLSPTPVAKTTATMEASFDVASPQDQLITDKSSTTIAATVPKDSLVVVQSPLKQIVEKSKTEQYKATFPLALGQNTIQISIYPSDQTLRPQQKTLTVYYLDEQ